MLLRLLPCIGCILCLAGCSSPRHIQTAPPQAAITERPDTGGTAPQAPLAVIVEPGKTPLPDGIQALRFRIEEVRLRRVDGTWRTLHAEGNSFEFAERLPAPKTVLSTDVDAATFDAIALTLSNVFVLYDAHAGGPLTLPEETPIQLPVRMSTRGDQPATLRLRFEPGASLSQDDRCRWFFLPFFDAAVAASE